MTRQTVNEFQTLVECVRACRLCARMNNSERIFGAGSGTPGAPIMFIGEAPGRLGADTSAIPFHGDKAGDNFERLLAHVGLTRYEIFVTNAVLCNPRDPSGNNATPSRDEIHNCSQFLITQLDMVRPRLIVTLGAKALQALAELEDHDIQLSSGVRRVWNWRGIRLVPLYHPGQRAMIHRSFANQLSDYQFVAETWRAMNRAQGRTASTSPTKQSTANIARAIVRAAQRISYFALHKIFYLIELENVRRTGERLSTAYVVRQKDGPYVTDLNLLRLRSAVPELIITGSRDSTYLQLSDARQATFFDQPNTQSGDVDSWILQAVKPLAALSNAELKRKVYLTRPMRNILLREKKGGELLYNSPIDFSTGDKWPHRAVDPSGLPRLI